MPRWNRWYTNPPLLGSAARVEGGQAPDLRLSGVTRSGFGVWPGERDYAVPWC